MKEIKTRRELIIAAQKYAKAYVGSDAMGTKEQDQQEWVAEFVEELDRFYTAALNFPKLSGWITVRPPEQLGA